MKYVVPELLTWFKFALMVMVPFLIAAILSVFMEPLVEFFSFQHRVPRFAAVTLAMLVFFGSFGVISTLIIIRLTEEFNRLYVMLPVTVALVQQYFNEWMEKGIFFYGTLPKGITNSLQETIEGFSNWAQHLVTDTLSFLIHLAGAVPGTIMIIIVSLIATFFFSKDKKAVASCWLKYVPAPWGQRIMDVGGEVVRAFRYYIRAQFILVSISATVSIVGLTVIGSDYALTIGLLVGIFDMIPVLGPGTIYIPWALWAFITGNVVLGLKLTILYLLVMVIRAIMEAKVIASSLGLHPLAVLIAMFIGLKTIGVLGLVLGPITVIAIKSTIKAIQSVPK